MASFISYVMWPDKPIATNTQCYVQKLVKKDDLVLQLNCLDREYFLSDKELIVKIAQSNEKTLTCDLYKSKLVNNCKLSKGWENG